MQTEREARLLRVMGRRLFSFTSANRLDFEKEFDFVCEGMVLYSWIVAKTAARLKENRDAFKEEPRRVWRRTASHLKKNRDAYEIEQRSKFYRLHLHMDSIRHLRS